MISANREAINTKSLRGKFRSCSYWPGIVALIASLLWGMQPAEATLITQNLSGSAEGWTMTYDNDVVDAASWTAGSPDTLNLSMSWDGNSDPTTISFAQQTNPPDGTNFGFRVDIDMFITNDSGTSWDGFEMFLDDPSAPAGMNNSAHDDNAHFHDFAFAHFLPFSMKSDFENTNMLELTNGSFDSGTTERFFTLAMHQYEVANTLRNFDWILTPSTAVPEPSSIILLSIGLAGLGFTRRRKS